MQPGKDLAQLTDQGTDFATRIDHSDHWREFRKLAEHTASDAVIFPKARRCPGGITGTLLIATSGGVAPFVVSRAVGSS